MKKIGFIVAGSLLALSLVGCSQQEGKSGLLTLKGKQAFEFDQMYQTFQGSDYGCQLGVLQQSGKNYQNMGADCTKAYADLATKIKDKFDVSNVKPQDIDGAYTSILKESNEYANTHLDAVMAAQKDSSDKAQKEFFS